MQTGNFTSDGDAILDISGAMNAVPFNTVYVKFVAGSGTIKVQVSPDDLTWFDISSGLTETGIINFQARFLSARIVCENSVGIDVDWWAT